MKAVDIDRLHDMLIQQVHLHQREIEPTVTVVVKYANDQNVTYSSWERYKAINTPVHSSTSDVTLKYEFLVRLPDTPQPQRCVVSVNIDSALPMIEQKSLDDDVFPFFIISRPKWRTLNVKIDFVDYLLAKSFLNVVEEWFKTLVSTPTKRFNSFLLKNMQFLQSAVMQIGRVGMASFLIGFAFLSSTLPTLLDTIVAAGAGLLIWSCLAVADDWLGKRVMQRVAANTIPSVILISDCDRDSYAAVISKMNSPWVTVLNTLLSWFVAIALNLVASYIFVSMINAKSSGS